MSENRYTVTLTSAAAKQFRKLDRAAQRRLAKVLDGLAADPRPVGVKALQGRDGLRLRVGDHRVLYRVADDVLEVLVVKVGHRREVYDR